MFQLGASGAGLWQWLCSEAGQFCVDCRLRTPLGRPQQTLTSIEAALKRSVAALKTQANSPPSTSDCETQG